MDGDLTELREYVTEIKEDIEQLNRKLDEQPPPHHPTENVYVLTPRKVPAARIGFISSTTHRL